ncbi:MAG: hypothetical protein H6741_29610 [Alphaproteobacteria bacterium]|nr:hypothetical protein [Alphaproteobacteria bacterium]MCB9796879.1 hypothetical protein [Alphaproteobacteria bacterium]
MTSYLLSLGIVLAVVIALTAGLQLYRGAVRRRAATPPQGEAIQRQAQSIAARIFVDRSIFNGPQARKTNRAPADLVLTPERLLVATHHGRILELTRGNPGFARCTGPRRLVIEGQRPMKDGAVQVRVELILDAAEQWAAESAKALGSQEAAQLS